MSIGQPQQPNLNLVSDSLSVNEIAASVLIVVLKLKMSVSIKNCAAELRPYYHKLPWLHSHPFCWPDSSSTPQLLTNPWAKVHVRINVVLNIGYFAFVVIRTVQAYRDPREILEQQLYLLLVSVMHAGVALYNSSMLLKGNDFIQFQRSYIKFAGNGNPGI